MCQRLVLYTLARVTAHWPGRNVSEPSLRTPDLYEEEAKKKRKIWQSMKSSFVYAAVIKSSQISSTATVVCHRIIYCLLALYCARMVSNRERKKLPTPLKQKMYIFLYTLDVMMLVFLSSVILFFSSVVVRLGVKSGGKFFVVVVVGDLWASSALCLCRNVRPCCASLNFWLLTSLLAPHPPIFISYRPI